MIKFNDFNFIIFLSNFQIFKPKFLRNNLTGQVLFRKLRVLLALKYLYSKQNYNNF